MKWRGLPSSCLYSGLCKKYMPTVESLEICEPGIQSPVVGTQGFTSMEPQQIPDWGTKQGQMKKLHKPEKI